MVSGDEKFSVTVKAVRNQLGLSQEELARELGVSFATINRWENDKTTPSKLAYTQFSMFCKQRIQQGLLSFPGNKK